MILPQDGGSMQDTEGKAFERWMGAHYEKIRCLKPIFLLDALYGNDVIAKLIKGYGGSFIIACKEGSQKNIFSYLEWIELEKYTVTVKDEETGRRYLREYSWMPEIPLTNAKGSSAVNYIELKETRLLTDEQKKRREAKQADNRARLAAMMAEKAVKAGKAEAVLPACEEENRDTTTYAFVTDIEHCQSNIAELFECARHRSRGENGYSSLKNRVYSFERNFGHGKKNLANVLATLMLLTFSCHTLLGLTDELYKEARGLFNSHASFLKAIARVTSFARVQGIIMAIDFIMEGK
jgi:hypothetical protein